MVRKVNKGVSLVEVLIALAIFSVMMIPIVNGLITGMKTTTTGKEVQNRNEYAQNLMESMKEVPIDVLNDGDASYFEKLGSKGVAISHTESDPSEVYPYDVYTIKGTTYLGVERTEYSYLIEMSSQPYAVLQAAGKMNPNNVTSGLVEDLDQSKVALISATLANYDTPARDALLTKKMTKLREMQGDAYDPIRDAEKFNNDTGNRIINIEVKGDASSGFDVKCTLNYSDNGEYLSIGNNVGMVEYTPYQKHFDKLPNIYLMYNVGVYNEQYTNDYITYDISGVDEKSEVNVFVIETAANYSQDIKSVDAENENVLKGDASGLYRKANGNVRDGASISMALLKNGLTEEKRKNFHVYHNMFAPLESDYKTREEYETALAEWNNHNSKNLDVVCDSTAAGKTQMLYHDATHIFEAVPSVQNLNQALSGMRGLYEVKVWMQEGASLDEEAIKKPGPVLQGTRGGGEID
ncbi:MAG: prepilin-type N-terminal cleavage/methylation domain-containing protein [Clostridiales bacterium]|nr:prepilin-type N-terminal cleavage/methylation domain-containing protein [Clostridiales bacterium]